MSNLEAALKAIKLRHPKFQVVRKQDSLLMRLIGGFLQLITLGKFNSFMTAYTTTIGYTVYVPTYWPVYAENERAKVLRHEAMHMQQKERYGSFWFSLSYVLLPLPIFFAYFRLKYEMEAYAVTMHATLEYDGEEAMLQTKKWIVGELTGPSYFWTWHSKKRVELWWEMTAQWLVAHHGSGKNWSELNV